jgi:hypothetical protein
MMASRSLCILDTNVLIDMHIGGVLGKIFGLPYEFASPDLILDELETLEASELLHLGLRPLELSGEEVLYVEQLARRHAEVSVRDLFALVAAASRKYCFNHRRPTVEDSGRDKAQPESPWNALAAG